MGSRLSKRKHLGVPDKSTDQKAEKVAMEMEGTSQESPETHLAAEMALDATQVMGKAHCTEKPVPGTTEEIEIQTATEHSEAQPSAETTEGNKSQPEAQMPPAVPQITETRLDMKTSEHTGEVQSVEESSLDPTDETEAATEHDESSPTGETTEMSETQLNALHNQGTEAQFAGEIHPIEISVLKIDDQPPARNGEETEVPVAMPTMQEALREAEPAAQTPQMMGEVESIAETAVASTDVIAAHLAVQDTQLGEMQLAEMGESQKVTDHAEACSTAELMEAEAQPASPSTYKSFQDTEESQPLAEKSLEPTEVNEVPSAETTKGNKSQPEVQMPPAVPQITETQLDTETSEHTSEAQPVEKSSLNPTDETEAAMEHDEYSATEETTEMSETQLNALHNQGTEAQFAGEIEPIEISVLKIDDQPPAQNGEGTEVLVAMPTMQEALREAEPPTQTPQMMDEAESFVEAALASKDVIAAHLAVQDTQLGEMQLAEMGESQKVTDHAETCSTAELVEVTEAQPASPSMYQSLQDTEESQPLAEKSLKITEVSEVQSIARAIEETNEGQPIAQAIQAEVCSIEQTSQKTTEIMIESQFAAVTTRESGDAQPIEPPSIAEVAEVQNAAKNSEDQPSSETTEVSKTPPIALHVQKTKAVAGEGQPAIETSEVMADPQHTMLGEPDTEAHKTIQSIEEISEGPAALPAVQDILQELLPAGEAQQAVEIIEESLHVTGGTQLLAETKSQNTTENNEAHLIPETEAASVPNTQTPQELGAWPAGETAKAAEGKSTEDMVLDTAKVNEAPPAGENKAHPNTKVREEMEVQAAGTVVQATGTDAQESHQEAETMKETVTQSTEWSMPEGGRAQPTAEAARMQTAAPSAQKSEPATETTAGNSESCPIVQATEEMAVLPVAETAIHIAVPATQELAQDSSETQPIGLRVQETEVQSAAQTAEVYTTALTILKFIKETTEAAAKTTEENEACPISGTVLETPEEAESLQSLMETTELKIKRGQEPQIPANRTGQEGGEHAAISKEEILNASEMDISVDAESELQQYTEQEDQSASLGASCELPQTLEPSSETQAFQPLESIVTAVDERGVQGEPKQTFSAFETQGRKGEMALHSDCGPTGSEAVLSKEISAREASDVIHMA